jgi:hypothetical protein
MVIANSSRRSLSALTPWPQQQPEYQPVGNELRRPDKCWDEERGLQEASDARERLQKLDPGLRTSNLVDELGPYGQPDYVARYVEGLRGATRLTRRGPRRVVRMSEENR